MKKQKVRGRLTLNPCNDCTESVKIHPIRHDELYLRAYGCEGEYDHVTIIGFDKRQIWTCYYWHFNNTNKGWVAERGNCYCRLKEKDFERLFGKWEIVYDE